MANAERKYNDTASNYGDIYNNPDRRFSNRQTNPNNQIERSQTSRPSEDGRRYRPKSRYSGPYENTDDEENERNDTSPKNNFVEDRYIDETEKPSVTPTKIIKNTLNKIPTPHIGAHIRGKAFATMTGSIALFIYPLQFVVGSIGIGFLGVAGLIESQYGSWVANFAVWWSGYDYDYLMPMAILGVLLPGIFGIVFMGGSALAAVLMRIKPLGGQASGLKQLTFMLGLFGYFCPGINLIFPWAIPWIATVWLFPR
jgi:hypothetical protein